MCPSRRLLILVTLAFLSHVSLARNLPRAMPASGTVQCLTRSQNLLRAVSRTLQTAQQTLKLYSCSAEEIDHEDITKERTSTVEACVPLELTKNESCVAPRETPFVTSGSCLAPKETSSMLTLCLSSIYGDLKMYQMEFKAVNERLMMDPKRQTILDQTMLSAIDEMMQVLNFNSEALPQTPPPEELDSYKAKVKLCILLHAFRIRAVTIDRVMSYLNSA